MCVLSPVGACGNARHAGHGACQATGMVLVGCAQCARAPLLPCYGLYWTGACAWGTEGPLTLGALWLLQARFFPALRCASETFCSRRGPSAAAPRALKHADSWPPIAAASGSHGRPGCGLTKTVFAGSPCLRTSYGCETVVHAHDWHHTVRTCHPQVCLRARLLSEQLWRDTWGPCTHLSPTFHPSAS